MNGQTVIAASDLLIELPDHCGKLSLMHLSKSSIRPSIFFSLIMKSRSIPGTNQYLAMRVKLLTQRTVIACQSIKTSIKATNYKG